VFFHPSRLGIATESNRRKLISAANKPVNKGLDGSLVFGTAPPLYMADGKTNTGTLGAFAVTGVPTVCSTSPTD
jgi:hypothetical protein